MTHFEGQIDLFRADVSRLRCNLKGWTFVKLTVVAMSI